MRNWKAIIPAKAKPYVRKVMPYFRKVKYCNALFRANQMVLLGITGTNGKTSTAFLTSQILHELGTNSAYIGTIGLYYNGQYLGPVEMTTPRLSNTLKAIEEVRKLGAKAVVMELSSEGLSSDRLMGLHYDAAAFTNLTQDHLDVHHTMEEYCSAKMKILKYLKKYGTMIVNKDDERWEKFIPKNRKCQTLGIGSGDYDVISYSSPEEGKTSVDFTFDGKQYHTEIWLDCVFNIYNYMTALALVNSLGYSINEIISISEKLLPPPGRNDTVRMKKGIAVVDYAHTPDGVLKITSSYEEKRKLNNADWKIITVIGCGGDRDKTKRPLMGEIATNHSDWVIFTNDNPRTEKPEDIMDDIISGCVKDNYEIIYDRESAIKKGVSMLAGNDRLLVLGKGHEEYQIIGDEERFFSDKKILLSICQHDLG